jgi:hypothetical protein
MPPDGIYPSSAGVEETVDLKLYPYFRFRGSIMAAKPR